MPLGANLLPWLRGRELTRLNRMLAYFLLLNQARPAFHAWFGVMPEVTPELRRMIEATL